MEIDDRIQALEERVAALEGAAPPESGSSAASDSDDPLWVLTGLRDRVPSPGAVVLAGTVDLPDQRRAEWQEGLTTEALLDRDWREAADVLAALGHPVRLALLQ
ncbi:MAG: ArsR family transcriptional regulator, partial [Nocardioides sp.]